MTYRAGRKTCRLSGRTYCGRLHSGRLCIHLAKFAGHVRCGAVHKTSSGFSACVRHVLVSKHVRQLDSTVRMFRRSHAREQNGILSSPSKYKAATLRQKSRSVIHNMQRHWQTCARCFLWALLAVSVTIFWCITFVRPTAWYRDDTGGHFRAMWQTLELRSNLRAGASTPPIMQGMISTQVRSHPSSLNCPRGLHAASHSLLDFGRRLSLYSECGTCIPDPSPALKNMIRTAFCCKAPGMLIKICCLHPTETCAPGCSCNSAMT